MPLVISYRLGSKTNKSMSTSPFTAFGFLLSTSATAIHACRMLSRLSACPFSRCSQITTQWVNRQKTTSSYPRQRFTFAPWIRPLDISHSSGPSNASDYLLLSILHLFIWTLLQVPTKRVVLISVFHYLMMRAYFYNRSVFSGSDFFSSWILVPHISNYGADDGGEMGIDKFFFMKCLMWGNFPTMAKLLLSGYLSSACVIPWTSEDLCPNAGPWVGLFPVYALASLGLDESISVAINVWM